MEKENLVIISKHEHKNSIYPIEQKVICNSHYNPMEANQDNYQINKINSSRPKIWCEICTPAQ